MLKKTERRLLKGILEQIAAIRKEGKELTERADEIAQSLIIQVIPNKPERTEYFVYYENLKQYRKQSGQAI